MNPIPQSEKHLPETMVVSGDEATSLGLFFGSVYNSKKGIIRTRRTLEILKQIIRWIGLRENLQENPIFNGNIGLVSCRFSLKPIHWIMVTSETYCTSMKQTPDLWLCAGTSSFREVRGDVSLWSRCLVTTIWLWLTLPWKIHPFFIGKPSISMGHLYHGYVSHYQRVYPTLWIQPYLLRKCLGYDLRR